MKKIPHQPPTAAAPDESANPLWIITAMLAVFAIFTAVVVAWG